MCSLYSFRKTADETRALLKYLEQPQFPPREHVHPASPMAIVLAGINGARRFALVRWGFVPSWAKEVRTQPLINARSETVYEKATFKNAVRRRRCLIPADGFYEWQEVGEKRKQAWFIHRAEDQLFTFGGIWEHWLGADGSELETAAMLTTEPNALIANIHDRSPVVIQPQDYERWLSPEEQVQDLLKAPPDDFWIMGKVESPRARKLNPPSSPLTPPKQQMDLL